MKSFKIILTICISVLVVFCSCKKEQIRTKEDLRNEFLKLKFGAFIHFNMATFHEIEWVEAGQDLNTFNPSKLDCGQWADAAKSANMQYAVLTTRHVDGFCLWDTKTTDYDVASTPLAGRDIVQEFCNEFRSRGIEPHLYYCIWDRNLQIEDTITRRDMDIIKAQLTELLTNYGKIPTITFDGWGNCGTIWTYDDYYEIYNFVKSLQPEILVTDHYQIQRVNRVRSKTFGRYQEDPDGKEFISLEEAYAINDFLHFEEPLGDWAWAPEGNTYASHQGPTIQSKWFWKKSFPVEELMSVDEIVNKRLNVLNERSCNLLLNFAPNPDGLLDDNVVKRLKEVGEIYNPN